MSTVCYECANDFPFLRLIGTEQIGLCCLCFHFYDDDKAKPVKFSKDVTWHYTNGPSCEEQLARRLEQWEKEKTDARSGATV